MALAFEEAYGSVEKKRQVFDETLAEGSSTFGIKDYKEEAWFSAISMVFKDVDPDFIQFVKDNIQDEDQAKDNNFYVIED